MIIFHSCILEEFKINDIDIIHMKEDWGMDVVSPLFIGIFEFKDLINDDTPIYPIPGEQESFLSFPNGHFISIPSRIIFEPASIIDSFNFMIQGNYSISSVTLEYKVINSAPFPLNLQMRFFENDAPSVLGPPIFPPSFQAGAFNGESFSPVETTQKLVLDESQVISFRDGNRIEFSTWFDYSELINQKDTFLSDYPVEISIVFYGRIKRKND